MMELLARLLVQQPLVILLVAAAYLGVWALLRITRIGQLPRANVFWVPALLWLAYAAWEWLVLVRSPEANIRVDLLLIWPILALATIWAIVRLLLGGKSERRSPR
jgi:hypothetical protein